MPTARHPYYGVVGNGITGALVAPDLTVAWLCVPRFDGPPVFASALDPKQGGGLRLELLDSQGRRQPLSPTGQHYLEDSGVLQTHVAAGALTIECRDVMPWGGSVLLREVTLRNAGPEPWAGSLVVRAEPVASVLLPVRWSSTPGGVTVEVSLVGGTPPNTGAVAISSWPAAAAGGAGSMTLDLGMLAPGESSRAVVAIGLGLDAAAAGQAAREAQTAAGAAGAPAASEVEAAAWRRWLSPAADRADLLAGLPREWREAYVRSLIVTRQLLHESTGGIVAALTASLPAVPGGGDNWDYRYVWLRDGAYGAMALDEAGFAGEAAAFYRWALARQEEDGHWRQPLYTLDGVAPREIVVHDLAGPGGEGPVRLGNAASGQLQLDNEGNILYGLWRHYELTGDRELLAEAWDHVRRAADWTQSHWAQAESGIWEIRGAVEHWVHGKALCCAALESAVQIATVLGRQDCAPPWRETARLIRQQVVEEGWDAVREAYPRTYDHASPMDISALALVFYGLLPADGPRIRSTVRQMEEPSAAGGLVMDGGVARYDYARLPFYLPTLWLAQYYLLDGREEDADRLIHLCLGCSTDLLLMAEHFDPATGGQWGNFPQLFSHEELVRTLLLRQRLRRDGGHPARLDGRG
ncbi:MAG: glycoside hydrolase family 15 protein [Symbiobacteriia bacterium]